MFHIFLYSILTAFLTLPLKEVEVRVSPPGLHPLAKPCIELLVDLADPPLLLCEERVVVKSEPLGRKSTFFHILRKRQSPWRPCLLKLQHYNQTILALLYWFLTYRECCRKRLRRTVWIPNAPLWHQAFWQISYTIFSVPTTWEWTETKARYGRLNEQQFSICVVGNSGEWVRACGVVRGHRVTHYRIFESGTEAG